MSEEKKINLDYQKLMEEIRDNVELEYAPTELGALQSVAVIRSIEFHSDRRFLNMLKHVERQTLALEAIAKSLHEMANK